LTSINVIGKRNANIDACAPGEDIPHAAALQRCKGELPGAGGFKEVSERMSGQMTFIGEGSALLYRPPSLESVQRIRPGLAGNERCGNLRKADRLW